MKKLLAILVVLLLLPTVSLAGQILLLASSAYISKPATFPSEPTLTINSGSDPDPFFVADFTGADAACVTWQTVLPTDYPVGTDATVAMNFISRNNDANVTRWTIISSCQFSPPPSFINTPDILSPDQLDWTPGDANTVARISTAVDAGVMSLPSECNANNLLVIHACRMGNDGADTSTLTQGLISVDIEYASGV